MTTVAPLSVSLPASVSTAAVATSAVAAVTSQPTGSAVVTLANNAGGNAVQTLQTYSAAGVLTPAPKIAVWENAGGDAVSSLLGRNAQSASTASRFHALGKSLLESIAAGGGNFSQSVVLSDVAQQHDSVVQQVLQQQAHRYADNRIALDIVTTGGAKVGLSLGSSAAGLAVQIDVSGTLSDTERAAFGKLADAFQTAIDGLSAQPPRLNLDALTQFDSAQLGSLELHAKLDQESQSIDFHADSRTRTLNTSGPAGALKLAVDLSNPALSGSAQQQAGAISHYLQQFDQARQRGHGDESLMTMFKDGFVQMLSNVGKQASADGQRGAAVAPDAADRRMLSGLADFSATVTQAAKSINPLHPEEVDSFSYQVSQQTTVAGRDQAGRRIVQQQSARLQAAYHQSLLSDLPLKLGTDKQSQNYSYHQIEDRADSTLHIAYDQGALVQALLQQTASRKTRVSSYELGKLIKDETTPLQTSRSTDFAAQLRLAQIAGGTPDTSGMQNEARRLQLMSRIGALALLNSDPGALKNADYSLS